MRIKDSFFLNQMPSEILMIRNSRDEEIQAWFSMIEVISFSVALDTPPNTPFLHISASLWTIEDKTAIEQMKLISQLDEDDKQTIFKLIDKMLTNKKFKTFFQENIQK